MLYTACRDKVAIVLQYISEEEGMISIDNAHCKMKSHMIVWFKDRESRNIVYGKRFQLTEKTSNELADLPRRSEGEGIDMYINESLTLNRSRLVKQIRDHLRQINRHLPKERKMKFKTAGGKKQICQNSVNDRF